MELQKAIQQFIQVHEIDNCSEKTLVEERRVLNYFTDWLKTAHEITSTDTLELAHLRGWIAYLQKRPNKNKAAQGEEVALKGSTVHHYGLVVLTFCHWLEFEGTIEKHITTRFKLPKLEQPFVPTFTSEDVQKLLSACEAGYKDKPELCKALTARNRAIVSVLLDTGIRRSELVGLRLCDVDREMRLLVVHRKGNKWQQVPISRDGFKPLHEYLTKHRAYLARLIGHTKARKEDMVFLADDGEPLKGHGVSKLFNRLRDKTGIEGKRVSAHNCRRYMATTQLSTGRSPLDVQRQMGHTTLNMTNRYASLTVTQLQRSHEEHSPLRAKNQPDTHGIGTGYWDE